MILNDEQEKICQNLLFWIKENKAGDFRATRDLIARNSKTPYITIGGYAGTGKTTLISEFRKRIKDDIAIAFVAFTGKAAFVVKQKLKDNDAIFKADKISTIHKLIYRPKYKKDKRGHRIIVGWDLVPRDEFYTELIIIDEASMISKDIWENLTSYKVPIIAIGDHGQLPPVGDKFSLMTNPDLTLTQIHRQAENNPIIKLSQYVRQHGHIPFGIHDINVNQETGPSSFKLSWNKHPNCKTTFQNINFIKDDVICLCGMNKTRAAINNLIRHKLLHNTRQEPYPNEKIICLKNDYNTKIYNGQISTVDFFSRHTKDLYCLSLDFGFEDIIECLAHKYCFGRETYDGSFDMISNRNKDIQKALKGTSFNSVNLFDFAYCTSVHKSQGSEWDKVVLFEERSGYWDDEFYKRWLYTAVTRAKKKLFVIGN